MATPRAYVPWWKAWMPKKPFDGCPVSAAAISPHPVRTNLPKLLKRRWNRNKSSFPDGFCDTAPLLKEGRFLHIKTFTLLLSAIQISRKISLSSAAGNVRITSAAACSASFPLYSKTQNPSGPLHYIQNTHKSKKNLVILKIFYLTKGYLLFLTFTGKGNIMIELMAVRQTARQIHAGGSI